jgi:OOP family OmpA-OmpF porin
LLQQSNFGQEILMNKQLTIISTALTALLVALPLGTVSAADRVWVGSDGNPVRSGFGECVLALHGIEHPDCMADIDGDGVADEMDKCPGTPKGTEVDAEGCTVVKDSDGDGVVDSKDNCPGTAPGSKVDAAGCAIVVAAAPVDSDGDGVIDSQDQCPGTPAGAKVNAVGCAEKIVMQNLNFENNSSILTAESKRSLDSVMARMKDNPNIQHITITGHTDGSGTDSYNQMLSEKRANAVRNYFIGGGIDGGMLTAKGAGESKPIASNSTREGRAKNRRVEFDITWK